MDLLQSLKVAQDEHGLRHGDHQRYRRYCTKRLTRLRRSLKLPQGDKRRYKGQTVTAELLSQDLSYLNVLLINAERAWSYAQQLKQESREKPRCKHHMVRRLGKAVKFAKLAEDACDAEVCAEKIDARTKLEVKSYAAWLRGMLYFELERWHDCLQELSKAKTIYETIASALDAESRVAYDQRIEEMTPNIRYCAYNLGDESATSFDELLKLRYQDGTTTAGAAGGADESMMAKLDTLISQHREKRAASLNEVSWLGRSVAVKSERVRVFLLGLKDLESSIARVNDTESRINLYEELLNQCRDAGQQLADELKNTPSQANTVSNLQYLHSYLQYIRATKAVERAQVIISSLDRGVEAKSASTINTAASSSSTAGTGGGGSLQQQQQQQQQPSRRKVKPQDYIRLYDTIVQSQSDILQLPGFAEHATQQTTTTKGSRAALTPGQQEYQRISAELLVNRGLRCRYIGLSLLGVKKNNEARALFERSLEYIRQAVAAYESSSSNTAAAAVAANDADERTTTSNVLQRLNALIDEIEGHANTARLFTVFDAEKQASSGQLSNQLKTLQLNMQQGDDDDAAAGAVGGGDAGGAGMAAKIKPPQKPMFFDIALDQVLTWEPSAPSSAGDVQSTVSGGGGGNRQPKQPSPVNDDSNSSQTGAGSAAAGGSGLGKLFKSFWSSDVRQRQ